MSGRHGEVYESRSFVHPSDGNSRGSYQLQKADSVHGYRKYCDYQGSTLCDVAIHSLITPATTKRQDDIFEVGQLNQVAGSRGLQWACVTVWRSPAPPSRRHRGKRIVRSIRELRRRVVAMLKKHLDASAYCRTSPAAGIFRYGVQRRRLPFCVCAGRGGRDMESASRDGKRAYTKEAILFWPPYRARDGLHLGIAAGISGALSG